MEKEKSFMLYAVLSIVYSLFYFIGLILRLGIILDIISIVLIPVFLIQFNILLKHRYAFNSINKIILGTIILIVIITCISIIHNIFGIFHVDGIFVKIFYMFYRLSEIILGLLYLFFGIRLCKEYNLYYAEMKVIIFSLFLLGILGIFGGCIFIAPDFAAKNLKTLSTIFLLMTYSIIPVLQSIFIFCIGIVFYRTGSIIINKQM